MKNIITLFILFAGVWKNISADSDNAVCNNTVIQPYLFEKQLLEMLEKLRVKLKDEGMPELNIPPLDPWVLKNEHLEIHEDTVGIKLELNATGSITGILGFEIKQFKLAIGAPNGGFKLQFDVEFPKINIDLNPYHMNLTINKMPLFGDGTLQIAIEALKFNGTGIVGFRNATLFLDDLNMEFCLGSFSLKITGYMHNEAHSAEMSELISQIVPRFLEVYHEPLSKSLSHVILNYTKGKGIPIS